MPQTNATVTITRRTLDWEQNETETTVGSYSVFLEEYSTVHRGNKDEKELGKGIIYLFSDVDLTDCYVTISNKRYEIVAFDRFVDSNSDFHHIELSYR